MISQWYFWAGILIGAVIALAFFLSLMALGYYVNKPYEKGWKI